MRKRSSKGTGPQVATIVEEITLLAQKEPDKNPAAVALGRRGGLKGGKARAETLSASRRSEIAAKAAEARWKRKP